MNLRNYLEFGPEVLTDVLSLWNLIKDTLHPQRDVLEVDSKLLSATPTATKKIPSSTSSKAFEKEKKYKFDQQETDKPIFERRMKKGATSVGPGIEIHAKSARTKSDFGDTKICLGNPTTPRSTPLNMFFSHRRNKILPLKLECGNHNNFDNQMNMTGQRCSVCKEASTPKKQRNRDDSPRTIKNPESRMKSIFKRLTRVQNMKVKEEELITPSDTKELIKPHDPRASREASPLDKEKIKCINKKDKKLTGVLTPRNSPKTSDDRNYSNKTPQKYSEKTADLRKNKNNRLEENADLRKNKSNRLEENPSGTIKHKTKIPSLPWEQNTIYDSQKRTKSVTLKRSESSTGNLFQKIQNKLRGSSHKETETQDLRTKTQLTKTRHKDNKGKVVEQAKCKSKGTNKSPVRFEPDNEEKDKNDLLKTKKSCLSKGFHKISKAKRFLSREGIECQRTKQHPVIRFPQLIQESKWTEKKFQNFQRAMSSMPKQKHGFQLKVATAMGLRKAKESQRKHTEEAQWRAFRKHPTKKMGPSSKASNGANTKQHRAESLKRKEEMRQFRERLRDIEDDDEDDDNDMFTRWTLQNQTIQLPNFEGIQDDDFLTDRDSSTSSSDIYTLTNTSENQHFSPDMPESINREDCDKLYQMQRENKSHGGMWDNVKKKLVGSNTAPAPNTNQVNRGIRSEFGNLFSCIAKLDSRGKEEEEEEEKDNDDEYFDSDFCRIKLCKYELQNLTQ